MPERDSEYLLTGNEVEVDLVVAPWMIVSSSTAVGNDSHSYYLVFAARSQHRRV